MSNKYLLEQWFYSYDHGIQGGNTSLSATSFFCGYRTPTGKPQTAKNVKGDVSDNGVDLFNRLIKISQEQSLK